MGEPRFIVTFVRCGRVVQRITGTPDKAYLQREMDSDRHDDREAARRAAMWQEAHDNCDKVGADWAEVKPEPDRYADDAAQERE